MGSVAWSPDSKWLASAGRDKVVKILEAGTGEEVKTLPGHTSTVCSVAWSPDSTLLASAGLGDGLVKVWDVATGGLALTLRGHSDCVNSVAWSPNGEYLASALRRVLGGRSPNCCPSAAL